MVSVRSSKNWMWQQSPKETLWTFSQWNSGRWPGIDCWIWAVFELLLCAAHPTRDQGGEVGQKARVTRPYFVRSTWCYQHLFGPRKTWVDAWSVVRGQFLVVCLICLDIDLIGQQRFRWKDESSSKSDREAMVSVKGGWQCLEICHSWDCFILALHAT